MEQCPIIYRRLTDTASDVCVNVHFYAIGAFDLLKISAKALTQI